MTTTWRTTTTFLNDLKAEGTTAAPAREAAWRRFDARFRKPIIAFARKMGASAADAEDVAQSTIETFIRKHRDGEYDRGKGRLSTWLFGIAKFKALDGVPVTLPRWASDCSPEMSLACRCTSRSTTCSSHAIGSCPHK